MPRYCCLINFFFFNRDTVAYDRSLELLVKPPSRGNYRKVPFPRAQQHDHTWIRNQTISICSKKSRYGLKSYINRSHFSLADEFKTCLTDGTRVTRKRSHQTASKNSEETVRRPKQAKTLQPTIQQTVFVFAKKQNCMILIFSCVRLMFLFMLIDL